MDNRSLAWSGAENEEAVIARESVYTNGSEYHAVGPLNGCRGSELMCVRD